MPDRHPETPHRRTCLSCGKPLPGVRGEGPCPACLMAEALAPDDADTLDPGPTIRARGEPGAAPPAAQADSPDPLEGTALDPAGRYKILQRIGEGGFGTVYMAEQTAPVRRRVAVKVLKAGMDTRQVVARFEAERQALAMMDHPNIAKVLDGGETEHGRPFFVMELVRGTPITAFCDREQLDTRARLKLFLHVCRAVQHAHQKGIIHRDLKPTNILVTVHEGAEPVPKVIDFGVAKAMEANLTEKTLFTRFEQMIGTPAYMSPEQAGTDAAVADIDTRADIYALGVLLYELLTGTTPLEPDTLHHAAFDEVRRLLREQDAPKPSARLSSLAPERRRTLAENRATPSPSTLDKLLRGDLDWIVMKAIEKDRRRRYETANALALDVDRFLRDDPVEARPPSTLYRLQKLARRHRAAVATGTAIATTLVAATIVSAISAIRAGRAEKLAENRLAIVENERNAKEAARQEAELQRNEAVWNQYVARQFPIRQAWKDRNFGHLEHFLDELVPAPGQPDFRGWEWAYFKDQCDQAFTTIEGRFPTWHPVDGTLALVRDRTDGGSEVLLFSAGDGSRIRTIAETPPGKINRIYNLCSSDDGSRIAYLTRAGHAVVLDARSFEQVFSRKIPTPKATLAPLYEEVRGLDLSHDGALLVTGTWAGNIQLWDVASNEPSRLLQPADNNSHIKAYALRFDPRGHYLAAALRFGRRSTWNIKTGQRTDYDQRSLTSSGTIAWNRAGTCFAVTDTDIDSIAIYALHQPEPLATLHHPSVDGLSWIGDDRLISAGGDQLVRIWDTDSQKLVKSLRIAGEPDYFKCSPSISPDNKWLAVPTDKRIKIVKFEGQISAHTSLSAEVKRPTGRRHRIEWSCEGNYLASVHEVMTVTTQPIDRRSFATALRVWDTRVGSLLRETDIGILRGVGWTPDRPAVGIVELRGRILESNVQTGTMTVADYGILAEGPSCFSPNGRWLILGLRDREVCIDQQTQKEVGKLLRSDERLHLRSSRWSRDSRIVALLYWDKLSVWDPFTQKVATTDRLRAIHMDLAWSPDGKLIAVGRQDGIWITYDATTLREIAAISGHRGPVRQLDWSADNRIATASEDGTVRVWDDATGDELVVFHHPDERKFLSVRWSPDDRRLAAGDDQGRVFIWGSPEIQPRPAGAIGLPTGRIARHRGLR